MSRLLLIVLLAVSMPAAADGIWWWQAYPTTNYNTTNTVQDDQGNSVTVTVNPTGQANINQSIDTQPPVILTGLSGSGNILQISAGDRHSLILKRDGTVWATGDNTDGQLGTNNVPMSQSNQWIKVLDKVRSVAACGNFSMAVRYDGTVWATGNNAQGQLGDGTNASRNNWAPGIDTSGNYLTNVIEIACGEQHALAITGDNALWEVGDDSVGQLGLAGGNRWKRNPNLSPSTPGQLPMSFMAGAGAWQSLVLTGSGVVGAGNDNSGQLGTTSSSVNGFGATNAPGDATLITTRGDHTLVYSPSQGIFGTGANGSGQLGDPALGNGVSTYTLLNTPAGSNLASVAVADHTSYLVDANGNLYGTGLNSSGQLGLNPTATPNVTSWTPLQKNVLQVAAGSNFVLILANGGMVLAAGDNTYGQLGLAGTVSGFQVTAR